MLKKILLVISTVLVLGYILILGYVFAEDIKIYVKKSAEYIEHFIEANIDFDIRSSEELELFIENESVDETDEETKIEINISDEKYYYYLLSELEQNLYKKVLSTYLSYGTEIDLTGDYENMDRTDVYKVHQYVLLDYPEIFWIDDQSSIVYLEKEEGDVLTSLNGTLLYATEELENLVLQLEVIVENIELYLIDIESDYEKALAIYEYLILNCEYDSVAADIVISESEYILEVKESTSIIGCLINGEAVCSGYSEAYTYLLDIIGIQSISVMGYADGVGHEWNMILLEGSYYNVDCTWGDPVSEDGEENLIYYYFGLTSNQMSKTHSEMENISYPICSETKYNYYVYNGLCFATYSIEELEPIFAESIENKEAEVTFTFTTYTEYRNALTALTETDLSKICQPYGEQLESQYGYATIEDLYLITIYLAYKIE